MTPLRISLRPLLSGVILLILLTAGGVSYSTWLAGAAARIGEQPEPDSVVAIPAATSSHSLRVMTYNIHHGAGPDDLVDLDHIAATIRQAAPDIVFLNEVDDNWARSGRINQATHLAASLQMPYVFYAPAFRRPYLFNGRFFLQVARYGNALLSKYPITSARIEQLPVAGFQERRAVVAADIVVGDSRHLHILGTHLGLRQAERARQVEHLLRLARNVRGTSLLMGDFNATPDAEEIKRLSAAWSDPGQTSSPTFPAVRPRKRIDYIFVSDDLTPGISAYDVFPADASDHLPVLVEIRF